MGKGDTPRPVADPEAYRENYERIFNAPTNPEWVARPGDVSSAGSGHIRDIIERIRRNIAEQGTRSRVQLENSHEVLYNVHPAHACEPNPCTIHRRSDHHMRGWKQHWREDRGLMERICEHGTGHPDPDSPIGTDTTHGCCGCCGCCGTDGA